MEKKKQTNGQLQRRIDKAIIHIDKTKETQEIYFEDKGLRLVVTEDFAIIETGFHRHVFSSITSNGVSRPYLYTKRFVEITLSHKRAVTENSMFYYKKLFDVLNSFDDKTEYNIATYFDWWCFNCFAPLYSIGETEAEAFMVYQDYLYFIARNAVLLDEHKDGLTNKQFIAKTIKKLEEFTSGIDEREIFKAMSDEQLIEENIKALQEHETENIIKEQSENES